MPTAPSGRPDRSGSENARRAKLSQNGVSQDDESLLENGPVDELDVDETDDALADDDLVAEDVDDDSDDDLEDDEQDDDEDDDRESTGTTLTKKRTKAGAATGTTTRPSSKSKSKSASDRGRKSRPGRERSGNPFVALARFFREVVGEMRKVLWPSRRELIVYTIAVIIFVTVLIAIVGGLDFGFARLILLIFG